MTSSEIAQVRGNTDSITPCATYPATDADTTWTSRTMIVTYMGIHHELQIIEGVPKDVGSPLWRDDSDTEYEAAGIAAGLLNAAHVTGVSAVGAIPNVGTALSVGVTAYDALKAIVSGITSNTIIKNITGVALVTLTSHEKYIFVKVQGSSDDRQILCYAGNHATYTISTLASTSINGIPTHQAKLNISDASNSKYYYEGYGAYATQVYYEYTRGISPDPRNDFHIMSVTIDIFGTERCFGIPYGFLVS